MEHSKKKEFIITEELLDKAIKKCSSSTVGRILKRFDTVDDKNILKSIVKELIYEEFRNLKVFIEAVNLGIIFKSPSK